MTMNVYKTPCFLKHVSIRGEQVNREPVGTQAR